jgi:hypothetical protein
MALETGTRIADLVPTNPVGATDFVSQGDDHIRLLKACIQGSFPALGSNAVTATADELNKMDGVTLTAAQINDAARQGAANSFTQTNSFGNVTTFGDAVMPDTNNARSIGATGTRWAGVWTVNINGFAVTDIARLSQANNFLAAVTISLGDGLRLVAPAATSARLAVAAAAGTPYTTSFDMIQDAAGVAYLLNRANAGMEFWTNVTKRGEVSAAGNWQFALASSGTTFKAGGSNTQVAITAFSAAGQTPQVSLEQAGQQPVYLYQLNSSDQFNIYAVGQVRLSIDPSGNFLVNAVDVRSLALISSTSETLVKGQIHYIDAAATLPAIGNGEWICLVNDSGSEITITEHSGDTTYLCSYGVGCSTFNISARGRVFVSGKGSGVVYVSGDIPSYT